MSKSSLLIGLALSLLAHAALLAIGHSDEPAPDLRKPIEVRQPLIVPPVPPAPPEESRPEADVPEPEPAPAEPVRESLPPPSEPQAPAEPEPTTPAPAPTRPPEPLEPQAAREANPPPALSPEVAPAPPRDEPAPSRGEEAPAPQRDDDEDDAVPPLRITWTGPDQVRTVAAALGLKIVAVDHEQRVVGQVALVGDARLEPFHGRFGDYSNRVRTLPRSYFGPRSLESAGRPVADLWILVPIALDRSFTATLRGAIEDRGLIPPDVSWVEAGFVEGPGGPVLRVTAVRAGRKP